MSLSALDTAIINNNIEIVKLLLDNGGIDINNTQMGCIPLCKAVKTNNINMLQLILDYGGNSQDPFTLKTAVIYGNMEIVQLLLEHGANAIINNNTYNPLLAATSRSDVADNIDLVQLLLNYGADSNTQDSYGNTPLNLAVRNNNINMVKLLLKNGAKDTINTSNYKNYTPLHTAVLINNIDMVQLLLNYGSNDSLSIYKSSASLAYKYSALHLAFTDNKMGMVKLILPSYFDGIAKNDINDEDLERYFYLSLELNTSLSSYILHDLISKDYKFLLDYGNLNYDIISVYFLYIFLRGGFKNYYNGYSLIDHTDITIDNFPNLDLLSSFVRNNVSTVIHRKDTTEKKEEPIDLSLKYNEGDTAKIISQESQIYQLILWFMIRWGYHPLFYYHWIPAQKLFLDDKIIYMDFIHNCTIDERLEFIHKLVESDTDFFSSFEKLFKSKITYTYYTNEQIRDISMKRVDSPIPVYVYGVKSCYKSKRTYTDMSHLSINKRYIDLITEEDNTEYWYKLTDDQKVKLGTSASYAIPVIRYAEGMSRGGYYNDDQDTSKYCGTFYYYEPDSDVYLLCNDVMISRNKFSVAMELSKSTYKFDRNFELILSETLLKFMEDNKYNIALLNTDMMKNGKYDNIMYAKEDVFDQLICIGTKAIGVEVVILTHMSGFTRLVIEVLDNRPREESLNNLVWRKGYKHRF